MDNDREYGIVVEKSSRYSGIVSIDSLRKAHKENKSLVSAQLDDGLTLNPDLPINDVLGLVGGVPYSVPVVDEQGNYFGVVTKSRLLQTLDKGRSCRLNKQIMTHGLNRLLQLNLQVILGGKQLTPHHQQIG